MEFNGLLGMDFDFFKKKDKMLKEEYDKARNEIKQHFRSLCYEVQKIYHKTTGGVLELDKDFQNFNKRSTYITAECKKEIDNFTIDIQLNSDNLCVELKNKTETKEQCEYLLGVLKNKKDVFWEYMMSNKYMILLIESKIKKGNLLKVTSFDLNNKNYDNMVKYIEDNIKEERYSFNFMIAFVYGKSECLKQGKAIAHTINNAVIKIKEIEKRIA